MLQALNRHVERVFDPSRKDKHWGRRSWRGINDESATNFYVPVTWRVANVFVNFSNYSRGGWSAGAVQWYSPLLEV
jgi:hypothetical protein